jgi:Ca-activated chloride channel family protein
MLQDWTPVTPGSVQDAGGRLMKLGTEGSTNLYAGFSRALKDLDTDRTSAVILVSDGGANVGPTGRSAFLKLLQQKDVRVFTFVMGQGANRPLLGSLADESGGFSLDVSNQDDLYGRILQAKAKLGRQALHGVEVELSGVALDDLSPQRLPSAYFGQQIVRFGRYRKPGEATLRLTARISGEERSWETHVVLPERDETYPELERLWALARIQELEKRIEESGEKSGIRRAIVELGTEHSIVTDYTSMIVVREEQFAEHGIDRDNRDRVDRERRAREVRTGEMARDTRADASRPMFENRPAPHVGGGGGGVGAAGPFSLGLLGALLGVRALLRRRSRP